MASPDVALLLLVSVATSHTGGALSGSPPAGPLDHGRQKAQSYLLQACDTNNKNGWGGLGSTLAHLTVGLAAAQTNGLKFVCRPQEFVSRGHETGFLGSLFGCYNKSSVLGDMVAYDAIVEGGTWPSLRLKDGLHGQVLKANWDGKSVTCSPEPDAPRTVYLLHHCGEVWGRWGPGWHWLRSQFHIARLADPKRANQGVCGLPESQLKTVVVHIRRGDDKGGKRGFPADTYVDCLRLLFKGEFEHQVSTRFTEHQARIVVLAETKETDPEMQVFAERFPAAQVFLRLGRPNTDGSQNERLSSDLDCMSLSDALISSRGHFSSLGGVLQTHGVQFELSDGQPPQHSWYDGWKAPNATWKPVEKARKAVVGGPGHVRRDPELRHVVHVDVQAVDGGGLEGQQE